MSEVRRFFVDRRKCLGCKTCELRCAVERGSVSKALAAAVRETVLPRSRVYVQSDGGVPQCCTAASATTRPASAPARQGR